MAAYHVPMTRTASTTASIGSTTADGTRPRRLRLYDLMFGCVGTPADNVFQFRVRRCTAAGTSTAVTPRPLNQADAATEFDAGENHTAEPTYVAASTLLDQATHQRNTFRWMAHPDYPLVAPATANNGFGYDTPTATALVVIANAYIDEE